MPILSRYAITTWEKGFLLIKKGANPARRFIFFHLLALLRLPESRVSSDHSLPVLHSFACLGVGWVDVLTLSPATGNPSGLVVFLSSPLLGICIRHCRWASSLCFHPSETTGPVSEARCCWSRPVVRCTHSRDDLFAEAAKPAPINHTVPSDISLRPSPLCRIRRTDKDDRRVNFGIHPSWMRT